MAQEIILDFLGKTPQNKEEWHKSRDEINVFLAYFFDRLVQVVRSGVGLGINDAFAGFKSK